MSIVTKGLTAAMGLNPWVVVGIGVAIFAAGGVAVGWPMHALMSIQVDAAVKGEKAAIAERDTARNELVTAKADVDRWMAKSNANEAIIAKRNAEVKAAEADAARTEEILNAAVMIADAERDDLNARIRELERKSHARPQAIPALDPDSFEFVCDVLRRETGAIPAGCPAAN